MDSTQSEAGSFRDPGGFIFTRSGRVFRAITRHSLDDWRAFAGSPLFAELQRHRLLIPTRPAAAEPGLFPEGLAADAEVVEHERVPFVSYPYEWSFEMLKDAALLHLDLLERCLPHDFILKDATPFNVQFIGRDPIFIDVLSFTRVRPGEPWAGYNQFCKMFLYPLMLSAYKQVPFQSWLRSELEGLDPIAFSRLLSARDLVRPGVFTHVALHAWLQKRMAAARTSVRRQIRGAGFSKDAVAANVRGVRRLLRRLRPHDEKSVWADYARTCSYSDAATQQKEEFVRRAVVAERRRLVWDLGCNVGRFSRLAAEHADSVVAMDADPVSVDLLYRSLRKEGKPRNILPLVVNLANPSPDQGWRGLERRALPARGRPDLTLCLALVHHMAISANVPVESFLAWLGSLGTSLVIEFVGKEDPMVQQLLLNKDDTYDDYNRACFESSLKKFFQVQSSLELPAVAGGARILYYATPALHAR